MASYEQQEELSDIEIQANKTILHNNECAYYDIIFHSQTKHTYHYDNNPSTKPYAPPPDIPWPKYHTSRHHESFPRTQSHVDTMPHRIHRLLRRDRRHGVWYRALYSLQKTADVSIMWVNNYNIFSFSKVIYNHSCIFSYRNNAKRWNHPLPPH